MAHRIVGFYQTDAQAQRAHDELVNAGYSRSNVKVYHGGEEPGIWDSIKEAFGFADEEDRSLYEEATRRGGHAVMVDLSDDDAPAQATAVQVLQRHNPIDLDAQSQQRRAQAPTPTTAAQPGSQRSTGPSASRPATSAPGHDQASQGKQAIPVVEEQLQVGKRAIQTGGVRVHSHVTEKPVEEQVQLREEHVRVERRPADRPVSEGDNAFRERTVEVSERREEPVVRKEARVVEEVIVDKDVKQRSETIRDTARRTDVDVEQAGRGDQSEFTDTFARELAADQRYRGRDWDSLEPEVRRSFEQRHPGRKWDEHSSSVRSHYERHSQRR
jgi:uncharacterized protein (TIGR02271 family)